MAIDTATDNTISVHSRLISAVFDTSGAAKKAVDDLVEAGIPRAHITQTNGQSAGETVETTAPAGEQRGFWESLKDLFLPADDRAAYAESLRRGNFLVTARVDEANYNRVLGILDTDGALDLDEQERAWKTEGWNGRADGAEDAGATPAAGTGAAAPHGTQPQTSAWAASPGSAPVTGASSNYATDDAARSAALGLRDDSHGRGRLRSYTFGEPATAPAFSAADASRIVEHMDVISADGQKIGEVDHLDGPDRIKLTRNAAPDGQHHLVPFAWIDHVDQHVHLKRTLAEIKAEAAARA